jgi:hypothetical protein
MKTPLSVALLLLCSSLTYGQYLGFWTYGGGVDAPISQTDGSPPGPEFTAQLFRVFDDGTLLPLVPTTTFRSDSADPRQRYYVKPVTLIVPDITFPDLFADPIEVIIRMRVWEGPDWVSSKVRGESEDTPVLLRNLLYPAANMVALKGFFIEPQLRIANTIIDQNGLVTLRVSSNSADLSNVAVERSADLVHWEALGDFAVANDKVGFSDPDAGSARKAFYRVRFP